MGVEDFAVRDAEELLRRERWPFVRRQLPGICQELSSLCEGGYTFSFQYLAQRLGSSQRLEAVLRTLDSSRDLAAATGALFQMLEEKSLDLSSQQVEGVFQMVRMIISQVRRLAIEPFVGVVREKGSAEVAVLDGYGEFRRRWDKLVQRIEGLGEQVGMQWELSMYLAPELHVPLKS